MKSKLLFLLVFLYTSSLIAKEGMWLPFLLDKMNEKEMRSMGMKITAKDIYDVNAGSLKDATVIFGSGCTGEVISNKGLVLTNHHCGYGTVAGLSSVEKDYLTNGFWAKNQGEEIPCNGLSVTFIVRIDDVTNAVKQGLEPSMPDSTMIRIRNATIEKIQTAYKDSTGYDALVKSFFYDNNYYLFLSQKYTDVRLVGFPPNGIGKFGGDTDNWAWPRHTGDFSVFRIYANKENKPAAYSTENIPFVPKKSYKINAKGVKENDFTWVYGFPGRTSEYLTSDGVAEVMNTLDPARISLREKRLEIMDKEMSASKELFIKYASKQSGIANYYKKWKGELLGLQLNNAIEKKRAEELAWQAWVNQSKYRSETYGNLLHSMKEQYMQQQAGMKLNEYMNEAIGASDLVKSTSVYSSLVKIIDTIATLDSLPRYKNMLSNYLKTCDVETDKKITKTLFSMYAKAIEPSIFTNESSIEQMYQTSFLTSFDKIDALLALRNKEDIKLVLFKDPAYRTYLYFDSIQSQNLIAVRKSNSSITRYYTSYIQSLKEYKEGKQFYPDANSTLRVTYGKVEGVTPKDGMDYTFQTTLDGVMQKDNPEKEEFNVPEKLKDLYKKKDYGRYAILQHGKPTVPLAFLASNHTTGGNSGSPVLNAHGELIGTNFDRIWEGTMSDILFDPNLCRNITLDIRYTLFIIDKFGEAGWLLKEMEIKY